jgi:hypothetical protein
MKECENIRLINMNKFSTWNQEELPSVQGTTNPKESKMLKDQEDSRKIPSETEQAICDLP